MKTNSLKTLSIVSIFSALGFAGLPQPAFAVGAFMEAQRATISIPSSSLSLSISGISEPTGQIMIALFSTEEAYESDEPFRSEEVALTDMEANVKFKNLPVGQYAFKLFHDVDGNGELNVNGFGIPSEPYYFSNDASDPFSAPEWDEANFYIPFGRVSKTIELD